MSAYGFAPHSTRGYRDRYEAGQVLADALADRQWTDPVVLGLARGGVPVAAEVARALGAPLRVSVARKIGAPGQPELALGAVTAHGPPSYDQRLLRAFHLTEHDMADSCAAERQEAQRREARYDPHPRVDLTGRDVVLVDDGLATGATAKAAVRMLAEAEPRRIVLAVPVGAPDAVAALAEQVEVVCPLQPAAFTAVGQWYRRFGATDDAEIADLLHAVNG